MEENQIFLILGLAGSGKTTFSKRLYSWLSDIKLEIDSKTGLNKNLFMVNLDPAVSVSYTPVNLDIRDHIDFRDIMEKYNLGPNGSTLTCLNIFCTQIDKFFAKNLTQKFIIIDTPGQIEAFFSSISGEIILNLLKSTNYKLNVLFMIDSAQMNDVSQFCSNLFFALSLKCRFNCDIHCVFNKIDKLDSFKFKDWLVDSELFSKAIEESGSESEFLNSIPLYFESVYKELKFMYVSASKGLRKEEFLKTFNLQ